MHVHRLGPMFRYSKAYGDVCMVALLHNYLATSSGHLQEIIYLFLSCFSTTEADVSVYKSNLSTDNMLTSKA